MRAVVTAVCWAALAFAAWAEEAPAVRVMTFNLKDVRTDEVRAGEDARLRSLAAVIQQIRPDILFLNEIAFDADGKNAARFAETYLARGESGLEPLEGYRAFAAPSNTGVHSGEDLNNDGRISDRPGARSYADDCLGFGTFPGQFAMALLVGPEVEILTDQVRTFRTLLWKDMPDARLPTFVEGGKTRPWYSKEETAILPLSSKSHWDIPVRLSDGTILHILGSHPTPPVFDGPEDRNGRRNADEVRFWIEYIDGASWVRDDQGREGGLPPGARFVIVGDLNADPERGDGDRAVIRALLTHARVQDPGQTSAGQSAKLAPDMTAGFGLRVDYVLPSAGLEIVGSGVWRGPADSAEGWARPAEEPAEFPSDHFPVWADVRPAEEPAPAD